MTPTSDERREVANQLRDARPSTYYDEELVDLIKDALLPAYPVETWREPTDVLSALADLIDPTCHIVTVEDCDGDLTEVHDCCGDKHTRDAFTGRVLPYCPDCGARVVRDDQR